MSIMGNYINKSPGVIGYSTKRTIASVFGAGASTSTTYRTLLRDKGKTFLLYPLDVKQSYWCAQRQTLVRMIDPKLVAHGNIGSISSHRDFSNHSSIKQDSYNIKGRLDQNTSNDRITDTTESVGCKHVGRSGNLLQSADAGTEGGFGSAKESTKCIGKRNRSRKQIDLKPSPGKDILYGISPCLLALEETRRTVNKVYLTPSFKMSARPDVLKIMQKIEDKKFGSLVYEVHRTDLDRISRGRPHQGISLETSRLYFEPLPEESTDDDDQLQHPPVYLGMEQILDPMNMGAILRSAYYLGVDRIIASKHSCCSLTPVVSKASSGVMEVMPVYATNNMLTYVQKQQDKGWDIVGTICASVNEGSPSHQSTSRISTAASFKLRKPTVLVIGGEGSGLTDGVHDVCTHLLTIPAGRMLHTGIDSLNVSVAVGILLQSILRQRRFQRDGNYL